jgi:hypothetical protein
MKEKILKGLQSLDVKADNYWNKDGQVNLNAFKFVVGEDVSREQIDEVAPEFNRESAASYFDKKEEGSNGTETNQGSATGEEKKAGDEQAGVTDNAGKLVDNGEEEPLYEIGNLHASEAPGNERLTELAETNPELHKETLEATSNVAKQADFDNSADGQIKRLLGMGKEIDLDSISDEELQKLREQIPERRNSLIEIREKFVAAVENEFYTLARIEEAATRAQPQENLADMVKRAHDANVNGGSTFDIDRPRQRVAQPIPPMKK